MAATEGSSGVKKSRRLSGEPALEEDLHFPLLAHFNPPDKLPSISSVIGRVRMLSGGGNNNMSREKAVQEVTKEIESKYYHDTVYCHQHQSHQDDDRLCRGQKACQGRETDLDQS